MLARYICFFTHRLRGFANQFGNKRRTEESDQINSILGSQYGYDKQDQLTGWNLSLDGDLNSVTYNGVIEPPHS